MSHIRNTAIAILMAAVGCLSATSSARAAGPDCQNASDQATLNECAGQDFTAADTKLNAAYKQLAKHFAGDADTIKLLVAAEKSWIAFRNADCDFASSGVAGGSVYPMIVVQCRTAMTELRASTLQDWLDCKEGDLSCPLQ